MISTTFASRLAGGVRAWSGPIAAMAAGAGLLAASACRQTPDAAATAPVRLVIGFSDPATKGANAFPSIISFLQDEHLLRTTRDGQFEPQLLERLQQSPDGLVWQLVLRQNLTFHDGTPIDAGVVANQLNKLASLRNPRPGAKDILKAEAKGPRDIFVYLRRPSRFLLDALSLEIIESSGKPRAGAGPFHLVDTPGDVATLKAFPNYFRGRPAIDEIEVRPFKTPRMAWSAMMRGEVHFVYEVAPEARDFVQESSGAQVKTFLRPFVFTLGCNLRHPVLAQRTVRVALNEAINRAEIIKLVFNGHATPATGMIWPQHWAHDPTLPSFRYDPAEAIHLLDQAGLPVKKTPGGGAMPSRLRFTCLVSQSDARYERVALVLQRQLVEVGIDMQLEPLPLLEIGKRLRAGQYEAFLLDLASSTLDWTYVFWHSPENGAATWLDSGYRAADGVLDRVRISKTDDELRAALRVLQRLMHDDPPAAFLCWGETTRALSARFVAPSPPDGDVRLTIWQWHPAPAASRESPRSAAFSP